MRLSALVLILCVALLSAARVRAAAPVVIDFESLRVVDADVHNRGFTYTEDGYTLNNLATTSFQFATFGTLEPRFPGSTALFNNTGNGVTELVRTGGGAFDLASIELAELNEPVPALVAFTGELFGGGSVNQTFRLDGNGPANGLQTFNFTGFNNVVRVTWTQVDPFHQFDNIMIGRVPEPASLALVLMGAAIVGFFRGRAKSAVS
jgi:hypothetical protein